MVVAFLKGIFGHKTKDTFIANLFARKKKKVTDLSRAEYGPLIFARAKYAH